MRRSISIVRVARWLGILVILLLVSACNLNQGVLPTPFPTPDLPTAEFLSPPNNTRVREAFDLELEIVARDPGPGVSRVELYIDDEKINEASPATGTAEKVFTVTMNWLTSGLGDHVIRVIPYRKDGTRGDEVILNIEVVVE